MTQKELDKQLSEIPDEVLIEKSRAILSDWCSGGKKFTMSVPPTKNCPDLIIAELIGRFKRYSENSRVDIQKINTLPDLSPEEIEIFKNNLTNIM